MQLRILGSLDITDDLGATIVVAGTRRRALIVRMLVDVNRVLSIERLIADLWEGHAPAAAPATLQSHMSHVRKVVGAGAVIRRSGGYVFLLGDSQLDVIQFEADLRMGRQLIAGGRSAEALPLLERALAHWRGPALVDVAQTEWSRAEIVRLEEMRLDAVELGLEARLAAGQSAEVVAMAEGAIAEHPLRENLWAHLIAGLYRQGRQADALEAFQRLRRRLVDDLGLEPSARLVELERAVLDHGPALDLALPADVAAAPSRPPARAPAAATPGDPRPGGRTSAVEGPSRSSGAVEDGWAPDGGAALLNAVISSRTNLIGAAPTSQELLAVACQATVGLAGDRAPAGARYLARLAGQLTWTNGLDDRLLVGRQAIDLARSADDPATLVSTVALLHAAVAVPWTLAWRLDLTAETLLAAERDGDPMLQLLAALVRLPSVIEFGDRAETDRVLDLIDHLEAGQGKGLFSWIAAMCRTWRQVITGDLPSAGRSLTEFRELGTRLGQPETAVVCYRLRLAMGQHAGGANRSVGHRGFCPAALLPLERLPCFSAQHAVDQGDYETAIRLLQDEAKTQFATPPTPDWLPTRLMWADVAVRLRATAGALLLYQQLCPYSGHLQMGPLTTSGGAVAESLGALAGLLGRYQDADRHFGDAIRLLRDFGAPFHVARAELAWARMLDGRPDSGRSQQARTLLLDAIALADRHGCHEVGRAARRELLEHTVRYDAVAVN